VLPESSSARQVQEAVDTEFGANRSSPIYAAVTAPRSDADAVRSFARSVVRLPGALAASPPEYLGNETWRVDVISRNSDLATQSQTLVRDIRDASAPFAVRVGGETAAYIDQQDSVASRLPFALAIAALTTLILLFAMTGSVVLPVKAVVMSLLTIVATIGVLVWVFQDGRLEGLLDFRSEGALNSTQPILVAAIAFALSTDYAVFLLTRIKEARGYTASDGEAVAVGMERTGRIVTAAALLLAIALGAFVTSRIVLIKELGFGVAFAVLLDAIVVRALLVPSLMRLLGEWNWWAPARLRRLHDRFGLHEGEDPPARPAVGNE
jgi:RND superfamily putative drug exporter